MALLSRKADYAILILSHLHKIQSGGNARLIAEAFGLSRPFVANILKELCQKGFVASHRGVKGGYAILRPLSSVTLADLLESLDEGFRLTLCNSHANGQTAGESCLLESNCTVKSPLNTIHQKLYGVLSGTTLAELFQSIAVEPPQANAVIRLLSLPMSGSCSTSKPLSQTTHEVSPVLS